MGKHFFQSYFSKIISTFNFNLLCWIKMKKISTILIITLSLIVFKNVISRYLLVKLDHTERETIGNKMEKENLVVKTKENHEKSAFLVDPKMKNATYIEGKGWCVCVCPDYPLCRCYNDVCEADGSSPCVVC